MTLSPLQTVGFELVSDATGEGSTTTVVICGTPSPQLTKLGVIVKVTVTDALLLLVSVPLRVAGKFWLASAVKAVPPVAAPFVLETATLKRRLAGMEGTVGVVTEMLIFPLLQIVGSVFVITAIGVGSTTTVVV